MANEYNKAARFRIKTVDVIYNDDLTAAAVDLDADLTALTGTWKHAGYLDRTQIMEIVRSGGEVTVDDTLNELAIDSEQAPIQRDITFAMQQIETRILELIYGPGLYNEVTDEFEIPEQPVSTVRQFEIIVTGTKGQKRGWITPGSLSSTADLSMDPTKTSAIPVSIKCLRANGKGLRMLGYGAADPAPAV